jgi:hypothetical protein
MGRPVSRHLWCRIAAGELDCACVVAHGVAGVELCRLTDSNTQRVSAVQKAWSSHVHATILLQHGPAARPVLLQPEGKKGTASPISTMALLTTEAHNFLGSEEGLRMMGELRSFQDPSAMHCASWEDSRYSTRERMMKVKVKSCC